MAQTFIEKHNLQDRLDWFGVDKKGIVPEFLFTDAVQPCFLLPKKGGTNVALAD